MSTKDELEQRSLIELAVLCQQVANNPFMHTQPVADEALKLKLEWISLQRPPNPSLKKQEETEAQLAALQQRMIEFLGRTP